MLNLIQHKYRYIKLHLYKYETEGCYNQSVRIICKVGFLWVFFSQVDFKKKCLIHKISWEVCIVLFKTENNKKCVYDFMITSVYES